MCWGPRGYSGFYDLDFGNVLDVCGEKDILIGVYGIANLI